MTSLIINGSLRAPERVMGAFGLAAYVANIFTGGKELATDDDRLLVLSFARKREIGKRVLTMEDLPILPRPDLHYETSNRRAITVDGRTKLSAQAELTLAQKVTTAGVRNFLRTIIEMPQDPHNAGAIKKLSVYQLEQGGHIIIFDKEIFTGEKKWATSTSTFYFDRSGHQVSNPVLKAGFRRSLGL